MNTSTGDLLSSLTSGNLTSTIGLNPYGLPSLKNEQTFYVGNNLIQDNCNLLVAGLLDTTITSAAYDLTHYVIVPSSTAYGQITIGLTNKNIVIESDPNHLQEVGSIWVTGLNSADTFTITIKNLIVNGSVSPLIAVASNTAPNCTIIYDNVSFDRVLTAQPALGGIYLSANGNLHEVWMRNCDFTANINYNLLTPFNTSGLLAAGTQDIDLICIEKCHVTVTFSALFTGTYYLFNLGGTNSAVEKRIIMKNNVIDYYIDNVQSGRICEFRNNSTSIWYPDLYENHVNIHRSSLGANSTLSYSAYEENTTITSIYRNSFNTINFFGLANYDQFYFVWSNTLAGSNSIYFNHLQLWTPGSYITGLQPIGNLASTAFISIECKVDSDNTFTYGNTRCDLRGYTDMRMTLPGTTVGAMVIQNTTSGQLYYQTSDSAYKDNISALSFDPLAAMDYFNIKQWTSKEDGSPGISFLMDEFESSSAPQTLKDFILFYKKDEDGNLILDDQGNKQAVSYDTSSLIWMMFAAIQKLKLL